MPRGDGDQCHVEMAVHSHLKRPDRPNLSSVPPQLVFGAPRGSQPAADRNCWRTHSLNAPSGVANFAYLKPAVAFILAFIGAKLLLGYAHVEISTVASLAVVLSAIASGVGASMVLPPPAEDRADDESL